MTSMDPWFLHQIKQITDEIKAVGGDADGGGDGGAAARRRSAWASPTSGWRLCWGLTGAEGTAEVRALRKKLGVMPVYKMVDTCAAEFESYTPYLYSCYDEEDEARRRRRRRSSFWAAGRTGSGRELSSITAAAMRRLRCAKMATRRSW